MNEGNQSYVLSTQEMVVIITNSFKVTYTGTVAYIKNNINFLDKLN